MRLLIQEITHMQCTAYFDIVLSGIGSIVVYWDFPGCFVSWYPTRQVEDEPEAGSCGWARSLGFWEMDCWFLKTVYLARCGGARSLDVLACIRIGSLELLASFWNASPAAFWALGIPDVTDHQAPGSGAWALGAFKLSAVYPYQTASEETVAWKSGLPSSQVELLRSQADELAESQAGLKTCLSSVKTLKSNCPYETLWLWQNGILWKTFHQRIFGRSKFQELERAEFSACLACRT